MDIRNNLSSLSVREFCNVTASKTPTPGGGSISALSGALAASLAEMVANLSFSKDNSASLEFLDLKQKARSLQERLLSLIEKDAKSFESVISAFELPKTTDEEKILRKQKIQEALIYASEVPMEVAVISSKIFDLIPHLFMGNQNAITDAMISAMQARNAVLGALLNVRINLAFIKDESYVKATLKQVDFYEKKALEFEKEILDLGYKKLSKE